MQKFYIQVLHYGDVETTLSCLNSLLPNFEPKNSVQFFLLISSNGTEKEDQELIQWGKKHFSSFKEASTNSLHTVHLEDFKKSSCILLRNNQNVGFASGCNPAIKLALQLDACAIWLLNNDATISKNTLDALLYCYQKTKGKSIIGTTVITATSPNSIQCAGGMTFNPFTTCVTPYLAGKRVNCIAHSRPKKLDYIYGASMLVPSEIFSNIGLLDESFFLFYEEIDFCRRAKKAGYSLSWCKDAIVSHAEQQDKKGAYWRTYHDIRSFTLFSQKHYPFVWRFMTTVHTVGRMLVQLKARDFQGVAAVYAGLFKKNQHLQKMQSSPQG